MKKIFIVAHTHWDREWYQPFQVFRARLVHCIDALLKIFETTPAFTHFMLDGQTIVLEDYLEVRPENEARLRELIRAGKIAVGPWYVLPDEFLVSGEALIRNLQRGTRLARDFGRAMGIGYLPDPFGHISQMPQILRGLKLNTAVLRRGLSAEPVELTWRAPDGSQVSLCYLRDSYDNIAWLSRDAEGFVAGLHEKIESLAPHTQTENFLMLSGTDHMEPWDNLPALIDAARAAMPDKHIEQTSLEAYVNAVRAEIAARELRLPVVRGELRDCKRHHLLPGVVSARTWLKQRNARAQTLLEKWAEPFAAIAEASDTNMRLSDTAWKYLLHNHPHDSICGCSIDAVHSEMAQRFDWVEQIAAPIVDESLRSLAAQIDTARMPNAVPLVVFNPAGSARTDCVQTRIALPSTFAHPVIVNARNQPMLTDAHPRNDNTWDIEFVADAVPGFGYKTFFVADAPAVAPTHAARQIENEFFSIAPNADGTLDIADKITGVVYRGAHRIVDGGDGGDLYTFCPPSKDVLVDCPADAPQIQFEFAAARQSILISMRYRLPAHLSADRTARAAQFIDEKIFARVSLYPGVPRIDFQTTVENRARDHRLRVEFAAPIIATHSHADQAFDVVARPIALPPHDATGIEQPRPELPLQKFVSLDDGNLGVTLATRGLMEYEVRREPNGTTLALTLLRCIGWLSRDDLSTRRQHAGPAIETPGAQEIGTHTFEYALILHRGDWRHAFGEAYAFAAPMRAIATEVHASALPVSTSFVQVAPREFVISAIKKSNDGRGIIVRGYNIGEEKIAAQVRVWKKFMRVARADLNENEIAPLDLLDGCAAEFGVNAKEIVTLKFE